jgi:hypothetical protein
LINFGGNLLGDPDVPNLAQLMEQGAITLSPILINVVCGILLWFMISIPVFFLVHYLILRKFAKVKFTGH